MIAIKDALTEDEVADLVLFLSRMTFDDFLKLTDGDGDENQAYLFSNAAVKLRKKVYEAADHGRQHANARA